ncbi:phosphoribosylamine--glycine ligase [Clostridium sp. YIM B02515]|uniref:Phosphoribosylamine--glycine ligase n=1 Tax=Clostridium rhizosphaerae TaxID=2803861 RepID=A0ABS1TE11_9CLOT|nr:phosphoribosylamine--glycine ligase [Clostridium rhizosphaerae]MBL4936218.1 phosphoribosylamine--glycine ligase [Clostridium rhizosphaerae]
MKILIIGGGGREHAIAWKLSQSAKVHEIYCAPGNAGTALENKCKNIDITNYDELINFAVEEKIDITIVGPEVPLIDGIVDRFKERGLKIFGPSKAAAKLEGSKAFSKEFMKKYGVRTAEYEVFYNPKEAAEYLFRASYPIVIKADGAAAGKGVVIANNFEEAKKCIESFMIEDVFKGSGKKIIIEEFLDGVEASILAVTDGNVIVPFLSSKDHKRIYDKDKGPNTGGMGAICPNPYCTEEVLKEFKENILKPTLRGFKEEKMDYIGIVFFGVMICKKGVYLLEYNVRMGDPETQAVLPLMETDFTHVILEALNKNLSELKIKWKNKYSCCVVAASKGYPEEYKTGFNIGNINKIRGKVFTAGAVFKDGEIKTSGGRVLSVVSLEDNPSRAREVAYGDLEKIEFENIYYRKDIGN